MYAPTIKSSRRVREIDIDATHIGVLLTDIVSIGHISYAHLLVVYERGAQPPMLFVSSEQAASTPKMPALLKKFGIGGGALPKGGPTGSHFLCVFREKGHSNYGAKDDYADLEKFEAAALDLLKGIL